MGGEDEDHDMCTGDRERERDGVRRGDSVSQRRGRRVELEQFDIEKVADNDTLYKSESAVEMTINIKLISMIFIATLIGVLGFCFAIILVMFKLSIQEKRYKLTIFLQPKAKHVPTAINCNL